MSRRKGKAKRRRRRRPALTAEQQVALEVSRRAAENRRVAREERRRRRLLEVMDGDCDSPVHGRPSDLSRWELVELERLNANRVLPLTVLPPCAYEATRLMRYVEAEG